MFTLLLGRAHKHSQIAYKCCSCGPTAPCPKIKRGAMAMSAMALGCSVSCEQAGLAGLVWLAGLAGMVSCP